MHASLCWSHNLWEPPPISIRDIVFTDTFPTASELHLEISEQSHSTAHDNPLPESPAFLFPSVLPGLAGWLTPASWPGYADGEFPKEQGCQECSPLFYALLKSQNDKRGSSEVPMSYEISSL